MYTCFSLAACSCPTSLSFTSALIPHKLHRRTYSAIVPHPFVRIRIVWTNSRRSFRKRKSREFVSSRPNPGTSLIIIIIKRILATRHRHWHYQPCDAKNRLRRIWRRRILLHHGFRGKKKNEVSRSCGRPSQVRIGSDTEDFRFSKTRVDVERIVPDGSSDCLNVKSVVKIELVTAHPATAASFGFKNLVAETEYGGNKALSAWINFAIMIAIMN